MEESDKDLVLLERVFLRFGSAETDEQLESCINKFLTPVLLKLSSPHERVRLKVVELLTHLNKRIKASKAVQLPMAELIQLYRDSSSCFVMNFALIYIKLGFPRLKPENQLECLSSLFDCLEGKPQNNIDSLMMVFIESLVRIKVSTFVSSKIQKFEERPRLRKTLVDFMLEVLLVPFGTNSMFEQTDEVAVNRIVSELSDSSLDHLEAIKVAILELLLSGILPAKYILIHAVVASSDCRGNVTDLGEKLLKKLLADEDNVENEMVAPLYRLYLGSNLKPSPEGTKQRSPANMRLKLKIMHVFIKLRERAILWPACIQIIFTSLQLEASNPKLMSQTLQFANMMIAETKADQLGKVARVLLDGAFLKLINQVSCDINIKQQAYTSIGILVKKVPFLVKENLKLVADFFEAMIKIDDSETKLIIKKALCSIAYAYCENNISETLGDELLNFLATQVETNYSLACSVVTHYVVTIFPKSNAASRFILLIIAGKNQEDISAEALKHLYSLDHKIESEISLKDMPTFCSMIETVIREFEARSASTLTNPTFKLPFSTSVVYSILSYLSLCLKHSAGIEIISQNFRHPANETPKIAHYLKHLHTSQPKVLENYLRLLQLTLQRETNSAPLLCLVECVGTIPELSTSLLTLELDWLETLFSHSKEDIRENTAVLYGVLVSYSLNDTEFDNRIFKLCQNSLDATSKAVELQHGTLLAAVSAVERRILKQSGCNQDWVILEKLLRTAYQFLNQTHPLFVSAACVTFGSLGRITSLPLVNEKTNVVDNPGILDVIDKLLEISENQKFASKIRLQACKAVGLMMIRNTYPQMKSIIEQFLCKAKHHKDVDTHLSIGETLTCCIMGSSHKFARNLWTTSESEFSNESEDYYPLLEWFLSELLEKASQPNPNSRQAYCFWLFALLKECAKTLPVKQRLKDIQGAFVDFLSENNDVVQDVASEGLAFVYENGDEQNRSELVELLIHQLSEGKRSVTKVTSDTKLFDEGSLGKTPSGENLSTYKELCSFASDMNKPDLIYTFLGMANHNAIWNSKKGAAFGFSSIAKNARDQLDPHLSKIIPRLYRYQFDPNPKTQTSMSAIWESLVPDPKKTIDLYHKEIFADLLKNLTSNQYRVRQSCCRALIQFLQGHGSSALETCVDSFSELWFSLFRVMDDVHSETRKVAQKTAINLSQLCTRRCDLKYGKAGEAMVNAFLTPVLEKGITSQLPEIRSVCHVAISLFVKDYSHSLKPYLKFLIPALLEATDDLELSGSVLSTQFSANAANQENIDSLRASLVKKHHSTETILKCVQFIDDDTLKEIIPKIIELLRNSVSLSSRVAATNLVTQLVVELKPASLQPYSGKLLSALLNGLTDRNSAIRFAYVSALGHVVKISKDSSVEKLIKKLHTIYLEKEDVKVRSALGSTINVMMRHSSDKIKNQSNIMVPLVFFAMQSSDEDCKRIWEDLWVDVAPRSESTLLEHLDPVCNFLQVAFNSPSWTEKAQAASGIKCLASKLGDGLDYEHRKQLITLLLDGLPGRLWTGKEIVLEALGTLCTHYPQAQSSDDQLPNTIADAVVKECKRENTKYRTKALSVAGKVLHSLEVDRFAMIYDIVQEINAKTNEPLSDDEDFNVKTDKKNSLTALKEASFIALGEAWPKNSSTQSIYQEKLITQCVSCLNNSERSVQTAVMSALHRYIERNIALESSDVDPKILQNILAKVNEALSCALVISKHSRLRIESLTIVLLLAKKLDAFKKIEELKQLKRLFISHYEAVSVDNNPEVKCRVADIKNYFESVLHD